MDRSGCIIGACLSGESESIMIKRNQRDQQYIDRLKAKIAGLERFQAHSYHYIHMLERELAKNDISYMDVRFRYVDWVEAQRAKEEKAGKTA